MKAVYAGVKYLNEEIKKQDFVFFMAAGYLVFSYLRPQAIYPALNILPWTQVCILAGLFGLAVKKEIVFNSVFWLLTSFLSLVWFVNIFAIYPEISRSRYDVLYVWLFETWFFSLAIRNHNQLKLYIIIFFLIIFKMSLFGARTWVSRGFGFTDWGIAGPSGYFANSGEFSLLMAMVAVWSFAFIKGLNLKSKMLWLLPITAGMTVLGASSRGGQLALLIGMFFLLFKYGYFRFKYILIICVVAYGAWYFLPAEQKMRFESMGSDRTSESRLEYWAAGIDMMRQYPYTGVGFYGFPKYFDDHYKEIDDEDNFLSQRLEVAHNTYIEIGSSIGIFGLLLYLYIMGYIYMTNRKVISNSQSSYLLKNNSLGLQSSLLTFAVGAMFMSVEFYPYIFILLMFSYGSLRTITVTSVRGHPA